MKKVFLIVFIFFLLIAAAVGIFAVTFNADSYRPFFQQKLQEALKKPVLIKKISLGWNGGIALEVDGLTIFKDEKSSEALLRLEKASVLVNAKPLLNRELQVSSVILESPEIDFIQTPAGQIKAAAPISQTPAISSSDAVSAAAMTFLVDEILVRNGRIHYADLSSKSPVDILINDLDGTVRNISLTGPVDFDGKASLFSGEQNVSFSGKLRARGAGAVDIENLLARINLNDMDTAKILKSFASLQSVGLAQGLAGEAEVSVKRISLADGTLKEMDGEAHLKGGRFKTAAMPLPLENTSADMIFSLNHLALQSFTSGFGSGKLAASGLAQNLQSPQPQTQAELSLTGLSVTDLAPPVSDRDPYMEGTAAFTARAAASGTKDAELFQTLNGNARLNLQNGVLRNMNVLREIITKLSAIPGVSKSIQSNLPEGYDKKLEERDTIFAPIDIPVVVNQGIYYFEKAVIESQSFALIATGKGDMLGNMQGEATLLIEPELSAALMAGVNELQYLADRQGQIQVPVVLSGVRGKFTAIPNVSYVVSRLATAKTQEVLSSYFQKKNGTVDANGNPIQQQNPYGSQSSQQQGGGGLLGQLLSTALQSQSSNQGSSQQ